jgi:ribosome-binding protein aMBF1 (putative translation factor)
MTKCRLCPNFDSNPTTVSIGDDTMQVCFDCADSISSILFENERDKPFSVEVIVYDPSRPLAVL